MHIDISGDVYEFLKETEHKSGFSIPALIRATVDGDMGFIPCIIEDNLTDVIDGVSVDVPDCVAFIVSEKASRFCVSRGSILDMLLRMTLATVSNNIYGYSYLKTPNPRVKIDSTLREILNYTKDRSELINDFSMQNYLWYIIKDISNEDIFRRVLNALRNCNEYKSSAMTSIELPYRIYNPLVKVCNVYRVRKSCLLSSFMVDYLNWLGQPVKELPEPKPPAVLEKFLRKCGVV